MSDLTISSHAPCYYADLVTGKAVLGTYDFSRLLALQAEAAKRGPVAGQTALTPEEVRALAGRYDPTRMSQPEYQRFIGELLDRGVLSQDETCDIGLDRVVFRPWSFSQGCIVPNLSPWDRAIRTLADTGGNALHFTRTMAQWRGSSKAINFRADAYQKIAEILERMAAERTAGAFR